jgi:hypothetical protein
MAVSYFQGVGSLLDPADALILDAQRLEIPVWELEWAIAHGAGWWYNRMRQLWALEAEVKAIPNSTPGSVGDGWDYAT